MKHKKILLVVFFLAFFVFQKVQADSSLPSGEKLSQINPDSTCISVILFCNFHVYMYVLDYPSGLSTPTPCAYPSDIEANQLDPSTYYGCGTEYPDHGVQEPAGYFDVSQQYYLRNVLPTEMDFVDFHPPDPEALKAQAVASRTNASWKSKYNEQYANYAIDNSTMFQVFIPGSYTQSAYQSDIDTALNATTYQYLSANGVDAIDAEFSSDFASSANGNQNYLLPRIEDPITTTSEFPSGVCDPGTIGNSWGMSQRGADRWALGNTCPDGSGTAWLADGGSSTPSVVVPSWNYKQILAHYYTGVDFLTDNGGPQFAPDNRWNLLNFNNNTPLQIIAGQTATVNLQIQNTSEKGWGNDISIVYQWTANGAATDPTAWLVPVSGSTVVLATSVIHRDF
ncbi:MAG: SpoIID/LytB domain-containing protein [Anaerolineales bacterium]